MNLRPIGKKVIVEPVESANQTDSGIFLPGNAEERPEEGTVFAVGKEAKLGVSAKDKVIYSKYGGTNISVDDTDYLVLNEDDILTVI